MKNVKIPVAHWDCILREREKERWRGNEGRDGNREGWRDSGRKGETERERGKDRRVPGSGF